MFKDMEIIGYVEDKEVKIIDADVKFGKYNFTGILQATPEMGVLSVDVGCKSEGLTLFPVDITQYLQDYIKNNGLEVIDVIEEELVHPSEMTENGVFFVKTGLESRYFTTVVFTD